MALTEAVKELIIKARIMGFDGWQSTHPERAIAIFQAADDQSRYLTDAELAELAQLVPAMAARLPVVQLLRDRAVEIVDEARATVLEQFPQILAPGGGLYPAERADACWRDFWQFLRCISYGIAAGPVEYTSDAGLEYMQQLYQALDVPLDAMVVGLEGVKTASLTQIATMPHPPLDLAPYFDHLIDQLKRFDTGK
jgi:Phycobilisome protein